MPIHDELGHRESMRDFLRSRRDASGQARSDLWRQGLVDFIQLDVDASVLWNSIGPAPLNIEAEQSYQGIGPDSGEVTDIAIDPGGGSDSTIYIATNDGGVWKSIDGGSSWVPTMDAMLSLSMGAVAVDPANPLVVYAGSGNFYDGGSHFTKGVGIYRSSDGGGTWSILDGGQFGTIFAGCSITKILVPAPDRLLIATDRGLYYSVDGGQNFGANSPKFNDQKPVLGGASTNRPASFVTCLLLDTASPDTTVYAGVFGVGVMKSTDGGSTFYTNLFTNPGAETARPFGNLEIAQSESDPLTLLVSVQYKQPDGTNIYRGLFQSTDGGQHWNALTIIPPAAADGFGQTDYDLTLGIDPEKPSLVYAGFQELWKSADGGRTFQSAACTAGQVHWDHHVLVFSPKTHRIAEQPIPPTSIYVGTDGGIAKSADGGLTWNALNGAIASNLFFGIDIGKGAANNGFTYGGCQDTGTSAHRPADAGTTIWHLGIDGDGGCVAVDPSDPNIVYGVDDGLLIKSTDAGVTWQTNNPGQASVPIGNNLPFSEAATIAIALEQNGTNTVARVVYVAYNNDLYISSDAGVTFGASAKNTPDNIAAVATTSADSRRIWIGTANGSVHVSANAGATWDQGPLVTQPGTGPVASIAIDPTNVSRVAVAYSGLSGINSKYRTQRIFLTANNGNTWDDVSGTDGKGPVGNLPDLPLHSVVFDTSATPAAMIVASDAGVMRCTDATVSGTTVTATWKIYGAGLPNVSCSSLAIDNTVSPPVLRVGTYGRGCFEITRPAGPTVNVESNLGFGSVPVGSKSTIPVYVYNCGDAPLRKTALTPLAGSADFSVSASATSPVTVAAGATKTFDVIFAPSVATDESASFGIQSDDLSSPLPVLVSGRGVQAAVARLSTNPSAATGFGTVASKNNRTISVQMFNTGTADLHVLAINVTGSSDFSVDPAPVFPITIAPGGESDVTLKYAPTQSRDDNAAFEIVSDGIPASRTIQVYGTGRISH
jgi:hypothetical protein